MKTYEVTLGHDTGSVTIRTRAETIGAAIESICESEKAPQSAVKTWRVIPTARQIKRTKALLSGI